ncbi:V-set immunoregulatory receptor L homeolog [Xenopus laevis]|uniref:MGC80723 protein n=1 Tax=Xenopus laevis TaxID=8355 RepID=Q6GP29_XENLA|nr:V-set immunoregulatory receptor L homeolog [Xenopus laevis]AAH73319.1 MGC80723 protein [Xenopus laevis]
MEFYRTAHYPTCRLWRGWPLLCLYLACYQDAITAFSVSALYSHITCPEGQNVNLTCTVTGHVADKHDTLVSFWHFSKDKDCTERRHTRNTTERDHHHKEHPSHSVHNGAFQITLTNVSQPDSGGYCCYVVETSKKHHTRHSSHSYIEFQVKTDDLNLYTCKFLTPTKDDNNSTAAALAIVSCVIGVLCLPLILFLVYKQRRAISHRRAQELVRMDSEAQGIENPVFDDPPPANVVEHRPRLVFMASRQQSESDRHLLSEPNTPLSPPCANECFFPSLEPVPDSPDPENV